MSEYTNNEDKTIITQERYSVCEKHPLLKAVCTGLLIFLGAFCAFYVVTDWHLKRMLTPPFHNEFMKGEQMIKKQMQEMDKAMKPERALLRKSANIIHLEQNAEEYKVLIDLRAFDNNENNLQVSANGNILTISGRSIRKSKNNEQISEFQQNYMFGDNVQLAQMQKETNGNYYVITIPIKEQE